MAKRKPPIVVERTDIITVKMSDCAPKILITGGGYNAEIGAKSIWMNRDMSPSALGAWDREDCDAVVAIMGEVIAAYKWLSLLR